MILRIFLYLCAIIWMSFAQAEDFAPERSLFEVWSQYANRRRVQMHSEFGLFFDLENALFYPLLKAEQGSLLNNSQVQEKIVSESISIEAAMSLAKKKGPREVLTKEIVSYTNEIGVTEYARIAPFSDLVLIAAHNLGFDVNLVQASSARSVALSKFLMIRILALQAILTQNPNSNLFDIPAWRPTSVLRENLGLTADVRAQFYLGDSTNLKEISEITSGVSYGDFPNHVSYLHAKGLFPLLPSSEKIFVPPSLALYYFERLKMLWMLGLAVKARNVYFQEMYRIDLPEMPKSQFHTLPYSEIATLLIRDKQNDRELPRDHETNVQLLKLGTEMAFGGSMTYEGLRNTMHVGKNPLEKIVGSIDYGNTASISYHGISRHREACRKALKNPDQKSFDF